jgi:hypothetical protein
MAIVQRPETMKKSGIEDRTPDSGPRTPDYYQRRIEWH